MDLSVCVCVETEKDNDLKNRENSCLQPIKLGKERPVIGRHVDALLVRVEAIKHPPEAVRKRSIQCAAEDYCYGDKAHLVSLRLRKITKHDDVMRVRLDRNCRGVPGLVWAHQLL